LDAALCVWREGQPMDKDKHIELPIAGAVVTGVEAHPKKPHMYRVTLKLDFGTEPGLETEDNFGETAHENADADERYGDWNSEVDALIVGAQTAKRAKKTDLVQSEESAATWNEATARPLHEETVLTIHEDTLVSRRLLRGRRLTAEEVEVLRQDEQKEEAYRAALLMLERKARTTAELMMALKRKGYAAEVAEACAERLRKMKMLDDSAYAKRFTEQRAVGQRKGRMLIRQELLQRGVDRQDVEQAIGELDGDVEREAALALARKRWPSTKGNDRERQMKLMGMLLRRGFPNSLARMAAQQAAAEAGEAQSDGMDEDDFYEDYDLEQ